ncbi:phage shock protein PspA [Motiliproteus coralliicola]|uniref:Phage shock protein PspA n=1 Tax=Motiliproteus coralliicola TaxID=2283196 RepID=A0A369WKX5_9GAMM|nr:phage shock protein PspA [Motiliproteus coralliicola]RDE22720.1 phage shock protein PspA [Motiliproteus coralliicola]
MGIFSRFQDIVNSNITSLLDRAEDPKKMIRQMIQEMEDTLIEVRTTSAKLIADKKELQRRIETLLEEAADWLKKTELAISKGREDLAKGALMEKRRAEEAAEAGNKELSFLNEQLEVLNDEIGQLQSKLEAAKAKQKELLVREQTGQSRLEIRKKTNRETLNRAFDKFDQYERRLDDLEGQVEAYDMGNTQKTNLADEINDLAAEDDIQQELDAIKNKMKNNAE